MPLSENERKILQEIEQNLSESDPHLVQLSNTTVYRHASRQLRWSILGFLVGFGVLVATFANSLAFGIAGFLVMLGAGLVGVRALQKMGRAGFQSVAAAAGRRSHDDQEE